MRRETNSSYQTFLLVYKENQRAEHSIGINDVEDDSGSRASHLFGFEEFSIVFGEISTWELCSRFDSESFGQKKV